METFIDSRIMVRDPSKELVDWCNKNMVLDNPVYIQLLRRGKQDLIDRYRTKPTMSFAERVGNAIYLPFGVIYAIYPMIAKGQITTSFAREQYISIKGVPTPEGLSLYDYQEEAVNALIKAKGGVLKAGCGAGKTITGIELIHRIGQRFIWIVHTRDLLNQAKEDFLKLYPGMDIGLITEGKLEIGRDGAIATVQTLVKIDPHRYSGFFNVVVVDECHRCADRMDIALMYKKVLDNLNSRYKYGLTATPYRQDGLTPTIYFNIGCSPKGKFEPTFVVERSRIKTMDAIVEAYDVSTPVVYEYSVICRNRYAKSIVSDDSGEIDLSFLKKYNAIPKQITNGRDRRNFTQITDKKKKVGVCYDGDLCRVSGLKPKSLYTVEYEVESSERRMLNNPDGTIDYVTLISYLTNNQDRNKAIIDKIVNLTKIGGRKVAVLSQSVSHCDELAQALTDLGIKTSCVTGKTKKSEREEALEHTDRWDVIVATIQLFKEGIDIKTLDTVFIVTPMKNPAAIEQSCGRCERYLEGKKQPLFIYARDINFKYCLGVFSRIRSVIKKRK